jgi:hypothetical protein
MYAIGSTTASQNAACRTAGSVHLRSASIPIGGSVAVAIILSQLSVGA